MQKVSIGEKVFKVFNYIFLTMAGLICILPMLHLLAISFSSKTAATAGYVILWPVEFTTMAYKFILDKPEFLKAFLRTLERLFFGIPVSLFLVVLIAYPLSKSNRDFKWRTIYVWVFVITMLFSGGLIPLYMTVNALGLIDSIWALILPQAVPAFYIVLVLNFFRGLPRALEESAFIDGASHWRVLWNIYLPLSTPVLATVTLFLAVSHWNSWFDGLIFMNSPENYPLQSYLQIVIIQATSLVGSHMNQDQWKIMDTVSDKTAKAAQIIIGAIPILLAYPFLQKYFIKGIMLGSVKG